MEASEDHNRMGVTAISTAKNTKMSGDIVLSPILLPVVSELCIESFFLSEITIVLYEKSSQKG